MMKCIQDLIALKAEGDYWDFKEEWYSKKIDMLHDIICMANNLVNRETYIIIGVNDLGEVVGVSQANRKNQQNVIDFLKDKKFAGEIRPEVYVHTIFIQDKEVDVLVIANTTHTPYYLTEDYKDNGGVLYKANIYTRVGDTNTPKIATADINNVEWLWKKRFGIIQSIKERFLMLLDNPNDWHFENEYDGYNTAFPEFQIRISQAEFENKLYNLMPERILFIDADYYQSSVELLYNSTVVHQAVLHHYDGGKKIFPEYRYAHSGYVFQGNNVSAPCYVLNDFTGKLLKLWTDKTERDYALRGNPYLDGFEDVLAYRFLLFNDEKELISFNEYAKNNSFSDDDIANMKSDDNSYLSHLIGKINKYNKTFDTKSQIAEGYIIAMVCAKLLYDRWKEVLETLQ